MRTRVAGIMAAGTGSRLASVCESKPLLEIEGVPLISHALGQLAFAGVREVFVVVGANDQKLADFLLRETRFADGVHTIGVPPGVGTGASLQTLLRHMPRCSCIISTADTIAPVGAYARLARYAESLETDVVAVVLCTQFVHDEDPIWVVSPDRSRIAKMSKGIEPTGVAFGNVRWLSRVAVDHIAGLSVGSGERDMRLMSELIELYQGRVRMFTEFPVFDIDDPTDVDLATSWLKSGTLKARVGAG